MLLVLDAALTGGMEYPALSDQLDQALVPRGLYNDVMQCHIRLCDLFNVIGLHRRFKGIAGLFQIL